MGVAPGRRSPAPRRGAALATRGRDGRAVRGRGRGRGRRRSRRARRPHVRLARRALRPLRGRRGVRGRRLRRGRRRAPGRRDAGARPARAGQPALHRGARARGDGRRELATCGLGGPRRGPGAQGRHGGDPLRPRPDGEPARAGARARARGRRRDVGGDLARAGARRVHRPARRGRGHGAGRRGRLRRGRRARDPGRARRGRRRRARRRDLAPAGLACARPRPGLLRLGRAAGRPRRGCRAPARRRPCDRRRPRRGRRPLGAVSLRDPRRRHGRRQDGAAPRGTPTPRAAGVGRLRGGRLGRDGRADVHRDDGRPRPGDRAAHDRATDRVAVPRVRGGAVGGAASAEPEGPPRRAAPVRRGAPGGRAGRDRRDGVRVARPDASARRARVRGDPAAADGRGGGDRGGGVVRRVPRPRCPEGDAAGGARPRDPLPARHRCSGQRPPLARADPAARRAARAGGGHAADDDGHSLRGHRVAAARPRSARPARPRGGARVLRRPRARAARGRRLPRRSDRPREGRPHRSHQAARRLPLRRADGHGEDRDREGARRVPVRVGRAARAARHVRVPDAREPRAPAVGQQHGIERRGCGAS